MLNHFPVKGGIYDTMIPTEIMAGDSLHYQKHIGLHIVQYFQVHEEKTSHTNNKQRTKGFICMGSSSNM